MLGNNVLGVLDIQQNSSYSLGPQDVDLMEFIAGQIAIALRNAWQFELTQEKIEAQEKINTIVGKITSTTSFNQALQVAAEELIQNTNSCSVKIKFNIS